MQNNIVRYSLPILWMGVIFVLSSFPDLPHAPTSVLDFFIKKTAHVMEYSILFWLWQWALFTSSRFKSKRFLIAGIICFIFALSDELHQAMVPGRTPTMRDVGIDMIGVMLVYLIIKPKRSS